MGEDLLYQLHEAAEFGSPQEVAALAAQVDDVDEMDEDRTALWRAVHARKYESVDVLLAAGADPSLPMMFGWSPARLSLTTARPLATDEALTAEERAAIAERDRLVAALGDLPLDDGYSVACVAGIDVETALHRLDGVRVEGAIGLTTVPGGCVLMQSWGYDASTEDVLDRLSAGTVAYGMYANPKGGNHGGVHRDGASAGWDIETGGGVFDEDTTADVLLAHLYLDEPVAFCCAYVGLRPTDNHAFTAPDLWLRPS